MELNIFKSISLFCTCSSLLLSSVDTTSPCELLRRTDCSIAVDNNMFFHLETRKPSKLSPSGGAAELPQPGLSGVWYKSPSMHRSHGRDRAEKTLRILLFRQKNPVKLSYVSEKSYFQIDRSHQEFSGDDIRIIQDIALLDDTVLGHFRILNPKGHKLFLQVLSKAMNLGEVTIHKNNLIAVKIKEEFHKGMTEVFSCSLPVTTVNHVIEPVEPRPKGWKSKKNTTHALFIKHTSEALSKGQKELSFSVAIHLHKNPEIALSRAKNATRDPQDFFTKSTEKWNDFFSVKTPVLLCDDPIMRKFYYWAFYVLRADQYNNVGQPIKSYICPSKYNDWLPLAWDEDTAHIVTGARWYNTREELDMVQNMVLHFTKPEAPFNYGLITIAGREVYLRTKDEAFLRKLYDNVIERQKIYCKNMTGDLVHQVDSFLVGWDNSIRYKWGNFNKNLSNFERPIIPVDLNSYLTYEYQILAGMAKHFGEQHKAQQLLKKSQKMKKLINLLMWDEKTGFYYDIFADDKSKLLCQPCSGFFPLFAHIPNQSQAERLGEKLLDPKKFNTPYAIPTMAVDTPKIGWGWSGSVCGRNNWLIGQGFAKYSQNLTKHTVLKTIKLFTQHGMPRALGYQHRFKGGSNPPLFSTEISGALDLFVRYYIGFEPLPNSQIQIFPAALPPATKYLQWGPFHYQGKQVIIRYDAKSRNSLTSDNAIDYFNDGLKGYSVIVDNNVVFGSQTIPDKPIVLTLD